MTADDGEGLLEDEPEWTGVLVFTQIAVDSRANGRDYVELNVYEGDPLVHAHVEDADGVAELRLTDNEVDALVDALIAARNAARS